jgi:hypothetical protein
MSSFFDSRVCGYRSSHDTRSDTHAFVDWHLVRTYFAVGILLLVWSTFNFIAMGPLSDKKNSTEDACRKACSNNTIDSDGKDLPDTSTVLSAVFSLIAGGVLFITAIGLYVMKVMSKEEDPPEALNILGSIENSLEKDIYVGMIEKATDNIMTVLKQRSTVLFYYSKTIAWTFDKVPDNVIHGIHPNKDVGISSSDTNTIEVIHSLGSPRRLCVGIGSIMVVAGIISMYSPCIGFTDSIIITSIFFVIGPFLVIIGGVDQLNVWYGPSEHRLILHLQEEIEAALENGATSGTFTYDNVDYWMLSRLSKRLRGVGFGVSPVVLWRHSLAADLAPNSHTLNFMPK